MTRLRITPIIVAAIVGVTTTVGAQASSAAEWRAYGNDPGGTRFSAAASITPENVKSLRLEWVARTGDFLTDRGRFEVTPLLVRGTLYVSTQLGTVLALDPATGAERWRFDGPVHLGDDYGDFANRGVASWAGGATDQPCAVRIFVATVNARLIAPGGFSVRDVVTLVQGVGGRVVGADVVEYNPARDASGVTAAVAAKLVKELADRMLADGEHE